MLVNAISDPALEVAVVAAGDLVLRRFRVGKSEPLNVQVEVQDFFGFAGEAAQGDENGPFVTGAGKLVDINGVRLREGRRAQKQKTHENGQSVIASAGGPRKPIVRTVAWPSISYGNISSAGMVFE